MGACPPSSPVCLPAVIRALLKMAHTGHEIEKERESERCCSGGVTTFKLEFSIAAVDNCVGRLARYVSLLDRQRHRPESDCPSTACMRNKPLNRQGRRSAWAAAQARAHGLWPASPPRLCR